MTRDRGPASCARPASAPQSSLWAVVLVGLLSVQGENVACDCSRDVLQIDPIPQDDAGAGRGGAGGAATGGSGGEPVVLAVALDQPRGPISPLIYGMEHGHDGVPAAANRPTVLRYASFWISTYNWEINAGNGGETWCWENGSFFLDGGTGQSIVQLLQRARGLGAATLAHVPIGPHVAADTMGGPGMVDGRCPADVRMTADFLQQRFRRNLPSKDGPLSDTPDTRDGQVHQDEFAAWVRRRAGGQSVLFVLDFLPERWPGIFPALYPMPLTYADAVTRTLAYARGLKSAFPEAPVVSFALVGWPGIRHLSWAPDRTPTFFFNHLLQALRAAREADGQRLVDLVAVDWTPALPQQAPPEELRAARLQAPRSLWDPTYVEQSWITEDLGGPVRLIPRLKEAIEQFDPGTRLAFNGWSFGAGASIDGALLVADVLGILGREGVELAVLRQGGAANRFAQAGFRAYRNIDGQGAAFGDVALGTISADPARLSIYASADSARPGRYVFVVINKSSTVVPVEIGIGGDPGFADALVWRVTADRAEVVAAGRPLPMWAPGKLRDLLPAYSVAVYEPRRP